MCSKECKNGLAKKCRGTEFLRDQVVLFLGHAGKLPLFSKKLVRVSNYSVNNIK